MAEKTNEMTPMVGGGSQTHVQVPMQPMPMQGSAMAHAPMVQVPNNQMPMQGGQYVLAPMQQAHMPGPAPVHAPMMMQPMQTAPIQGSGQVQAPMTMQQVPVQGYVPAQGPMMQTQINLAGVPPGLEFLAQSAQLTIEQDMDALEWVIGCVEMENKYMVRNNQGTIVFKAEEQSSCFQRQCCGPTREFSMQLLSMNGVPAITMQRPGCMYAQPWLCACLNGISWIFNFFDSCIQEITVESPPGTPIGMVKQKITKCYPEYYIKDADGNHVMTIRGPCCMCKFCDVNFIIFNLEGQEIGKVAREASLESLAKDYVGMNSDTFGIRFPMDLDVKLKAVLLSACFLIDFMYFEGK